MANKRMFNIKIVDSDAFLDMPLSAQCLYFHLNMRADDDGFVGNPKRIQRLVGASEDDLKLLIAKRFLLTFENGVIVIKHWRMHNTLSMNRYSETVYTDEKKLLKLKENNSYSFDKGVPFEDTKYIEMSKRQSRRTKDEQKTNADIDLDIDKDIDKDLDIDIKEKEEIPYKEIIDCLNKFAKTNYRHTNQVTKDKIKARWNDGFRLNDFETVIKNKCSEWMGTDMEKYLRPKTLFGNNFESYLNQKVSKENSNTENVPDWYKNTGETEPDDELLKQVEEMKRGLNRET